MAVYLSSVFGAGAQLFTNQGQVLAGGSIETYEAGTSTPVATYVDNTQTTQNATAITLNSYGRPPNEIWIVGGTMIKMIVKDSDGVALGTYDDIVGVNDPTNGAGGGGGGGSSVSAWELFAGSPTFLSATTFSLPGNQTASFPAGTRLKTTNTGGSVYSTVSGSVFGAATTVTVVNDSTTLDSGLSAVYTSINTVTGPNAGSGAVHHASAGITYASGTVGRALTDMATSITSLTTNLAGTSKAVVSGGSSTAYTLAPVPAPGSYVDGQTWLMIAHTASGSNPTININSLGAKDLKQYNTAGSKIFASLTADATYLLAYDGTDVMVMNPTVPGAGSGSLKRITVFTGSGTWTKQADAPTCLVKVIGGGCGGGTQYGGGAGGYAETYVSAPGATEAVTIGAGGAGSGAAPVGSAGGASSFGSWAVAGGASSSQGGIGTTGTLQLRGGSGEYDSAGVSAVGGNSHYGGGGGGIAAAAGVGAANTGGGGGMAGGTGAAGGSGIVVVYEFG